MIIQLKSLDETQRLAKRLMNQVKPGTVIALEGDLGAGKTTFVKYCAQALGLEDSIDSPTFTLLKSYGPPFVHHIDAYRLEGGQSSADVEDAMDDAEAIIFIEWASNIKDALPQARIELQFRHISDHEKEVTILKEGPIDVKKLLND